MRPSAHARLVGRAEADVTTKSSKENEVAESKVIAVVVAASVWERTPAKDELPHPQLMPRLTVTYPVSRRPAHVAQRVLSLR